MLIRYKVAREPGHEKERAWPKKDNVPVLHLKDIFNDNSKRVQLAGR